MKAVTLESVLAERLILTTWSNPDQSTIKLVEKHNGVDDICQLLVTPVPTQWALAILSSVEERDGTPYLGGIHGLPKIMMFPCVTFLSIYLCVTVVTFN